ncbi:hypothetical protein GOP47_0002680 [Adiantum capillus-veneris]|uniref:Lipoxygenase n=1 Tax=Adiantum capillus-veneris TaxID=13818 RepID=A0A9D4VB39_ADICA|nr:hypothetical protein GOP47_0002680 [Adiantum capillus-veneris]
MAASVKRLFLPHANADHEQQQQLEDRLLPHFSGTVLLRPKGFVDLNDQVAHIRGQIDEFLGQKVKFQLVSSHSSSATDGAARVSKNAELRNWDAQHNQLAADQGSTYSITFTIDKEFGLPGALLVTNHHHDEFYLESVTLHDPDNPGQHLYFSCHSWIYNAINYNSPRVFFTNQAYLPNQTPPGLMGLRNEELKMLQGDGTGERRNVDRIYDYDVYNDLGTPDEGENNARPTLGGSKEFPYPRRCRTGRERNKSDPKTEKPVSLLELIYIPRDEIFDYTKTADFTAGAIKAASHLLLPAVKSVFKGIEQFKTMKDVYNLYAKGIDLPATPSLQASKEKEEEYMRPAYEILSQLTTDRSTGDTNLLKFPLPLVIHKNKDAWNTDFEFGRQTLGGMHPFTIERVKDFPPMSKLDPREYGPQVSAIRPDHIEPYLEGMTAAEALRQNKLYMLDYHDAFLPFIKRINALQNHKAYASRSIFFLTKKGALMPVAIELSLLTEKRRLDRVFVPPLTSDKHQHGLWKLAKTHAILNDTPVHQLVSHFVRTHASIEPFIIASHRQLSAMHPLMILLLPHFKNTLNINAIARKILLNADTGNVIQGGLVERTFTAGRYSLELSSAMYKGWQFNEQGLPADLIKRGMAVQDSNAKHGVRLLIEDYPYAVDGLEVWEAVQTWVGDYVTIYYKADIHVKHDVELQRWWQEVIEKGHGDKKDESWWPSMHSIDSLASVLTTIIWLASAHHAAVNFGQYPFAGHFPYRPTMGRRLVPSPGTPEYDSFFENPESFFLSSISSPFQAILGLAIIELLSTHASNEEYLGQRSSPYWTSNAEVMHAFERFQDRLVAVERNINERNSNPKLFNRYGDVQVPYTLMYPSSKEGITNMGIPNSTSI